MTCQSKQTIAHQLRRPVSKTAGKTGGHEEGTSRQRASPPATIIHCSTLSFAVNVRELKNCIERAFNVTDGQFISVEDISIDVSDNITPEDTTTNAQTVEDVTKNILVDSLDRFESVKEAAQSMGISISTFYRKMKKYGLTK